MNPLWTWGCPVRFGDYTKTDRGNLRLRCMIDRTPPKLASGRADWRDTFWWYRYLLVRRIHMMIGWGVE